jgi:hypothetical protein
VVVVVVVMSGCVVRHRIHVFPRCADGLPVVILVDVGCPPDGVCGYTCRPGRWEKEGR